MGFIAIRRLAPATIVLGTIVIAAAAAAAETPMTLFQRCQYFVVPDQRVKACTAALQDVGLAPKDKALAHYFRGLGHFDLRNGEQASIDLDLALELDADLWTARWVRAEQLRARREYGRAAADWTEVIRHNPQMASLYFERGVALDSDGRSVEALADFGRAIETAGPKDEIARFHMDRAGAYEGVRQFDKALADFNEAMNRGLPSVEVYVGRGRIEFLRGDYAAAIADFAKAADLGGEHNYAVLWLYLAQARTGKNALSELRRRAGQMDLKVWPGPIVRVFLGELKPEQVEPPAQPERWTEAARRAAAQCELSYYLAELRLAQRERAKALELFRAAVATGIQEYIEYRAAAYELQRMKR